MKRNDANRHVILSGCSGGGKSTLLAALRRQGFDTVDEPGRRIVADETRCAGKALPWVDPEAFARRAIAMASLDRSRMKDARRWVFFDRGLIDAAVALEHVAGVAIATTLVGHERFHRQVFLTPPWPEIYRSDDERQLDMEEGVAEYYRLLDAYQRLGYDPVILPKVDVQARADFVLKCLS